MKRERRGEREREREREIGWRGKKKLIINKSGIFIILDKESMTFVLLKTRCFKIKAHKTS